MNAVITEQQRQKAEDADAIYKAKARWVNSLTPQEYKAATRAVAELQREQ